MAKLRLLKKDALVSQVLAEQKRHIATDTVRSIIDLTCQKLADALVKGQCFRLPHLGTLRIRHLAAKMGRNPRTGAAINIPTQKTVRLVIKDQLKQRMNKQTTTVKVAAKNKSKKRK